jgi:23S rRNA (uracil1939-C5)-methyltransferase
MERGEPGEALEGRVRDVTQTGDAVIETRQGIVFARGALPDERVSVQPERRMRGVWHGRVLAVLDPSLARVEPTCPLFERCGGCPLMTLDDDVERRWKRDRLARVLARAGGSVQPELRAGSHALGYRGRARLAFSRDGTQLRLGYRAAGSREIVDAERCPVLMPALARGLQVLRAEISPRLLGSGEIVLALGAGERAVLAIESAEPQPRAVVDAAHAACKRGLLAGVQLRSDRRGRGSSVAVGDVRQELPHPTGALRPPVAAFAQANTELNLELVRCVAELAQPEGARVLELYAGSGNLTFALTGARALTAVEGDPDAAAALRAELQARGLHDVKVRCADAAEGARGREPLDVVVLDPPRAGARQALAALLPRQPGRIVYVSCELATLERDLRALTDDGYRIERALAFDMFPQTAHLESVVLLSR